MKKLALFVTLIWLTLSACQSPPASPTNAPSPTFPIRGVALSPQGFPNDYSQLVQFYEEAAAMPSGAVLHNGGWRDDVAGGSDAGEIPEAIHAHLQAAQIYGFTPIVVVGWRSGEDVYLTMPGEPVNDWSNQSARQAMLAMLVDLAETYQPPLLFLGNENDFYFETNPQDYARWIDFYNQAYTAIKTASPQTQVGPVFNYERLAGTGQFVGWLEPQWGALEAHDLTRVDVVGLTIYPFLGAAEPGNIPPDYMEPLFQRLGSTPLAITETGWPAELPNGVEPGWVANEAAQVEYLSWLNSALEGHELLAFTWLFLHPLNPPPGGSLDLATATFASISLRDTEGRERPVYQTWLDFEP